jgi:hypothetical protein
MIMDIKLKKEKAVKKFFEIKEIEKIKTSSKAVEYLLTLYDENIRLQNLLCQKEVLERLN